MPRPKKTEASAPISETIGSETIKGVKTKRSYTRKKPNVEEVARRYSADEKRREEQARADFKVKSIWPSSPRRSRQGRALGSDRAVVRKENDL